MFPRESVDGFYDLVVSQMAPTFVFGDGLDHLYGGPPTYSEALQESPRLRAVWASICIWWQTMRYLWRSWSLFVEQMVAVNGIRGSFFRMLDVSRAAAKRTTGVSTSSEKVPANWPAIMMLL